MNRLERESLCAAGLDPRDLQKLIDQVEQMATPLEDVLDALTLPSIKLVHLEKLRKTEDCA